MRPRAWPSPRSSGALPVTGIAQPPGLCFEDISFGYPERSERALDGFSLTVAPGERVAVVGRSGAGKTTIVSLLLRFFELDGGRILIGGRDTRELALAELRSLAGDGPGSGVPHMAEIRHLSARRAKSAARRALRVE
ncbi:MAG: ATP-binding cassette domain-containing protein [Pseudonocardiaceae bacterium]